MMKKMRLKEGEEITVGDIKGVVLKLFFRELWCLMDLDDSLSLTFSEIDEGKIFQTIRTI